MSNKQCRSCGLTKNADDFHKDSSSGDGRRSTCKSCFNRARRANRTDRTDEDDSPQNLDSSLGTPLFTDSPVQSGGFGTELVLTLGEADGGMADITQMCPSCCKYNVLFMRHLEGPGSSLPIGICNDCILQVDSQLVQFYYDGDIVHIVRGVQAAHLRASFTDV